MSRKFREPVLIVLTVGMFFEPLATDGKNFLPLRSVTNRRHDQVIADWVSHHAFFKTFMKPVGTLHPWLVCGELVAKSSYKYRFSN